MVGDKINLQSRHWADETPVIMGRRRNYIVEFALPDPRFGDGVWDVRGIGIRENVPISVYTLNFDRAFQDPRQHLMARELIMQKLNRPALLHGDQPRVARPAAPLSLQQYIFQLVHLFKFMNEIEVHEISQLVQSDLDLFLRKLRQRRLASSTICNYIGIFYALYAAGPVLSCSTLSFLPWGGRTALDVAGRRNMSENKTKRIPENVMGPILKWALEYVEDFSDDIVSIYNQNRFVQVAKKNPQLWADNSGKSMVEKLTGYFNGLRTSGQKIPVRPGEKAPYISEICMMSGIPHQTLSREARQIIEDCIDEIGLGDDPYGHGLKSSRHTGKPWRPPFADHREMHVEFRNLIAASYIVCAYLSGMRDSELQSMRVGCLKVLKDKDGIVIRRYVEATQYKGSFDPSGFERGWVVIEPVSKAIEVLTEITAVTRDMRGVDTLFTLPYRSMDGKPATVKNNIHAYISGFIEHINSVVAPHMASPDFPPIPDDETGEKLNAMRFRRSIAWHIANRPFGRVAGKIQYGHLKSFTFDAYVGRSRTEFQQEVEEELLLANTQDVLSIADDVQDGLVPAGPIGSELARNLSFALHSEGEFPGVIVQDKYRTAMVDNYATRLYPGMLCDCFFDADRAACLSNAPPEERQEPVVGACSPHCANACWRNKHLPVWENALKDVETLMKRSNRLSDPQRKILRDKRDEYKAIVKAIRSANEPVQSGQ